MLGIKDFWEKVASTMQGKPSKNDVIEQIREITLRRNQIVHEADLIRTNRQEPSLRPITFAETKRQVEWMEEFGNAVNDVIEQNV